MTSSPHAMRVVVRVMGAKRAPALRWPAGWPLPDIGNSVAIAGSVMSVRAVIFYPEGEANHAPFVCLVMAQTQ